MEEFKNYNIVPPSRIYDKLVIKIRGVKKYEN